MIKIYSLSLLLILTLIGVKVHAQRIILKQEDFNGPSNIFILNSGGPAGNSGPNNWIVNNQYNGNGIYRNTPDESNTFGGGGITGQPKSPYLHIHDSNTPGASNANYDTSASSDNFAHIADLCTQGYDTVTLDFYYIEEGSAADYCQLYYSINGGTSWVLLSPPSPFANTNGKWKYVTVSDPAFANQTNLQFGWRWINTGASTPKDVSFGLDDIFVVGAQNPITKPTLTISDISPSTICLGTGGIITLTLSKPLCDGFYSIALSDAKGNFNNGVLSYNGEIMSGQTSTTLYLSFPFSLAEGTCYKLKASRSKPPFVTSNETACFTLKNCGDSIQTQQPVVLYGPDTACTKSVIDVPFYSFGKYKKGNNFIAQMSDANGSFAKPNLIGTYADSTTWDFSNPGAPGKVIGLIPDVPPGCGYYIRVISTKPVVDPPTYDYYGPFCLRRCDILTDSSKDISVCVTPTTGGDATITLTINQWNTNAKYAPGDSFLVQVLSSKDYSVLNTGTFGVVVTNKNGTVTVSVPDLPQVIALLGFPGTGMYYIRLIALHSSEPWNTYGTLVRLTIGSVNPPGSLLLLTDTLFCTQGGGLVSLFATPDADPSTQYQWQFSPSITFKGLNEKGGPFYSPFYPPYAFAFNFGPPASAGYYYFTVRAVNNGCYSPWWDTVHLRVIPSPSETILGPSSICQLDTVTFSVKFTSDTHYNWYVTNGRAVDTLNNIFKLVCDSIGKATLTIEALNTCGHGNSTKTVLIDPKPLVVAASDTTVCPGKSANLTALGSVIGGTVTYKWMDTTATIATKASTVVTPKQNQSYVVLVTSNLNCFDKDTMNVSLYPAPDVDVVKKDITCFGELNGTLTAKAFDGSSPYSYLWNTSPEQNTATINNLSVGTYKVTVTDTRGCTADTSASIIEPGPLSLRFTHTQVSYGGNDGTIEVVVIGGNPPFSYNWSTEPIQTTEEIIGLSPGEYGVTVTDASGCQQEGFVSIGYEKNSLYVPNAFSPNGDGINDEFICFGTNLKEIYMAIYNRWGEKVFETSNLTDRWDGTYKGQPESIGAFAYYIKATFADGTTQMKKGSVTIIR